MKIEHKNRVFVSIALLIGVLSLSLSGLCCSRTESTVQAEDELSNTEQPFKVKEDVPKSGEKARVTFIELGSERCIPCIKMQVVMKEIQERYGDQVRIIFYDVWTPAGEPYARQYRIRVIPTQVFLDDKGQEYFRHEGYFPMSEVVKILALKGVQ